MKKDVKDLINNIVITILFFATIILADYIINKIFNIDPRIVFIGLFFIFAGITGLINDGQVFFYFKFKDKILCIAQIIIGFLIFIFGVFIVISMIFNKT